MNVGSYVLQNNLQIFSKDLIGQQEKQIVRSPDEVARLKAQIGTQGSQAMLTDRGDTNDKLFVTESPVETGQQANKVLLSANVETQTMKNVYPVNMVREAAVLGPLDQASWNPRVLDDPQRLEEEYMVFFSSQPQKAVRMNLKDIILNKSL